MAQPLSFRQWFSNIKQQMQMVGHESRLPQLYLTIESVYLRQFLIQHNATKTVRNNMRKSSRSPLGSNIPLQMSEKPFSTLYAKGNHIQPCSAIVAPFSTTVLTMLDIMRLQSPAYQFFFRGCHIVRSILLSANVHKKLELQASPIKNLYFL